jgi:endonuclease/exonuclease/phosphatase (EEP) superfamily protein YafD
MLSAILFTCGRKWGSCVLASIFALINVTIFIPYLTVVEPVQADPPKIRALSINLDFRNASYGRTVSFITKSQPQLLILEELSEGWEDGLRETLANFPYFIRLKYTNAYPIIDSVKPFRDLVEKHKSSLGLFSKFPFESSKLGQFETYPTPYVMGQFKFNGKPFTFFGAHLVAPISSALSKVRNNEIAVLTQKIQTINQPTVLLGDLNITPWSPFFKDLIQKTGLKETRKGRGVYPTWPAGHVSMQIPIDHSLTSSGIIVHSFRLGPDIGSDHLPLVLDFSLN